MAPNSQSDGPFPGRSVEYEAPRPPWQGRPFQPAAMMQRPSRPWLHPLLFVLTCLSTWLVGGAAYAFWLMTILTAHEFGHYFAAKIHRVKATLPYFIPFPLPPLGTMGAVIRMSPYIPNRRALFDIAVAGPLAGMVVAAPVTLWGIANAQQLPVATLQGQIRFGDPLLFQFFEWLLLGPRPEGYELVIGPAAFAGWVGLFVTALNLLPVSQLDGGHISHAVFGRNSRKVALTVFAGLIVMMFFNGPHYLLILALAWFAGLAHPPTLDDRIGLDPVRKGVALLALAIFILCFTSQPIEIWE